MKKVYIILVIYHFLMVIRGISQEIEESADIFLEEYSDEFQENFFEALKQKGIENYDKAINSLLECKRIDTNNKVIDYELAKAYFKIKEYVLAQEYAVVTVNSNPENIWYLNILVDIIQRQGNTINALQNTIPYKNIKLRENLALIYYKDRNYKEAEAILKEININYYTTTLYQKILKAKKNSTSIKKEDKRTKKKQVINPLKELKTKLDILIAKNNFKEAEKISTEALESFPMQPYFYYIKGLSCNKNDKYKKATEILESGLDYLLDGDLLNKKIFRELAVAYTALGNISKAEMYLGRIKK